MNTILVTGAQGFIGRYVVAALLACAERHNFQIIGVGRSRRFDGAFTHDFTGSAGVDGMPLPDELTAVLSRGNESYGYAAVDLLDVGAMSELFEEFRPEILVHLAGSSRSGSTAFPFRANLDPTLSLLEAIANADSSMRRIVFASDAAVYGLAEDYPTDERSDTTPIDLLGVSKLAAESSARILTRRLAVTAVWARIFDVMGPGQHGDMPLARLALQCADAAENDAASIDCPDLRETLDCIDVRDVAAAIVHLALESTVEGRVNVAAGTETSFETLVDIFARAAGAHMPPLIRVGTKRHTESKRRYADVHKLQESGFTPRYSIEESANAVAAFYRTLPTATPRAQPVR